MQHFLQNNATFCLENIPQYVFFQRRCSPMQHFLQKKFTNKTDSIENVDQYNITNRKCLTMQHLLHKCLPHQHFAMKFFLKKIIGGFVFIQNVTLIFN